MASSFSKHLLPLWLILWLPTLYPVNDHFPEELWSLWEMAYSLGVVIECAHCCWSITAPSKLGNSFQVLYQVLISGVPGKAE